MIYDSFSSLLSLSLSLSLPSSLTHPHRLFRKMLYGENNKSAAAAAASSKKQKKKHNFKPSDGYIEKYDFRGQPTVVVNEFEPEVFKQLVEYTHTGSVMLQARTLLGLMNAADHYGIEDLKQACIRFMEHCVTIDTVCCLLTSAEKYIQYKSTKILVQKMFEFVDQNAETILSLGAFATLPQHVVRIVLGRDDLQASETTKFEAAIRWSYRYCDEHSDVSLKEAFEPFADVIDYRMIPAKILMQRVKPVLVVDDSVILTALAFQADPKSIEHLRPTSMSFSNMKSRRTTSPSGPEGAGRKEFRRVQSSGLPLNTMMNPVALKVSHGGRVRAVTPTPDSRSIRGSSMPIYANDAMKRVRSQDAIDFLSVSDKDATTQHPHQVKGHHPHPHQLPHHMIHVAGGGGILYGGPGRDRMDSHNSHVSLLSSPPLSPASPSTESYQESTISTFSGSSLERENYHNLTRHSSSPDESDATITPQASINGGQRKLAYNPQALDTVVTLSSTNAVEV